MKKNLSSPASGALRNQRQFQIVIVFIFEPILRGIRVFRVSANFVPGTPGTNGDKKGQAGDKNGQAGTKGTRGDKRDMETNSQMDRRGRQNTRGQMDRRIDCSILRYVDRPSGRSLLFTYVLFITYPLPWVFAPSPRAHFPGACKIRLL